MLFVSSSPSRRLLPGARGCFHCRIKSYLSLSPSLCSWTSPPLLSPLQPALPARAPVKSPFHPPPIPVLTCESARATRFDGTWLNKNDKLGHFGWTNNNNNNNNHSFIHLSIHSGQDCSGTLEHTSETLGTRQEHSLDGTPVH